MNTLSKFFDLLSYSERKRAAWLLGMVLIMAALDVIGVASIMPFLAVLANPELVETNAVLNELYTTLGVESRQQFLVMLGILVFVLLISSLAFKAFTTYLQLRFSFMREYTIGKRLIEGYLHQPYGWFLNRHSADLGKTILSEVSTIIHGGMMQLMALVAQSIVALALLFLLVLVDPVLALTVGLILSFVYVIIFKSASGVLSRIGEARVQINQERFTVVSEAFGATKEVKIGGLEGVFIERFARPARAYAGHQATAQIIGQLPRFGMEAISFGGMLIVVLYLMTQSDNFASVLPVVGLYAFAGYRLMPALQQSYNAIAQLRFTEPAISALHADFMSLQSVERPANEALAGAFPFTRDIVLNNVYYSYPNSESFVLDGISMRIAANSVIGLVGYTGSGKSTLVDLILGLMETQRGSVEIDGQALNKKNRRSWQRSIGYVPQHIYLTDDSIAANIAFGIDKGCVDQQVVEKVSRIANLHDFITNDLPNGYQTKVGERGVRLSGGQRQRIGIARALYHNPRVLVLDEATSALDNLTEKAVMEAVHKLGHNITIILIAHRLSTVKQCDTIYLLEKGKLIGQGDYDELVQSSDKFRALAEPH